MTDSTSSGAARFLGTIANDDEICALLYGDELALYHLDPPLAGYRVVAAGQSVYPMQVRAVGDPPLPPEDPVTTYLFGTTGGEGLRIVWTEELFKADGRAPGRALEQAGYRLRSD